MEPIHVPPPPSGAFNKNRRISDLIRSQISHLKQTNLARLLAVASDRSFRVSRSQRAEIRALAQLIAHDPEVQCVGAAQVLANSPDEAIVLTFDDNRHRISILRGIVE